MVLRFTAKKEGGKYAPTVICFDDMPSKKENGQHIFTHCHRQGEGSALHRHGKAGDRDPIELLGGRDPVRGADRVSDVLPVELPGEDGLLQAALRDAGQGDGGTVGEGDVGGVGGDGDRGGMEGR